MTYYGWRVRFHFRFACGCSATEGPIFQKFAYQYAGLGAPQRCKAHGAKEVDRDVEKIDGPHGEYALGWWTRRDGTRIFLEWEPATGWVVLSDHTERRYPRRLATEPARPHSRGANDLAAPRRRSSRRRTARTGRRDPRAVPGRGGGR